MRSITIVKNGPLDIGVFEPGTGVAYSLSPQCIFRPNLSLDMYHTVSFRRGSLDNYHGYPQFKLLF